jgi:asparaginyl-tRNA synthetase
MKTSIISISSESIGTTITICGWVETARFSKKTAFIKLYDSWKTHLEPIQIVFQIVPVESDELLKLTTGDSIKITGQVVKSPKEGQQIELHATSYQILGKVYDPSTYPIAKTDLTLTHLRKFPHLECQSVTKSAIYGIRHTLKHAIELFFEQKGFTKTDMPLITFSECEGGCDPLQVTLHLTSGKTDMIPVIQKSTEIDFREDFFAKKAFLTVSGQLELETHQFLGPVYTETRAVRGEPSDTTKHLGEFTMIEMEIPFIESAKDVSSVSEQLIQFCIKYVLEDKYCSKALDLLAKKQEIPIKKLLTDYSEKPFQTITHRGAVSLLKKMVEEKKVEFTKMPAYDEDMGTEHERFLADVHFAHPVIITQYPKDVKSFYMPVIDKFTTPEGKVIEVVDCFDIIVPGVGELVGGSARIHKYEELIERITSAGMDIDPLQFYVDLRKCGSVPHGGMGMGFERLIKFITCVDSVRDCVAYPRYYKSGKTL